MHTPAGEASATAAPSSSSGAAQPAPRVAWLDDDEQRAWRALIIGATAVTRTLNRELLDAHDVSLDDYGILAILSEAPARRARFGALAEQLRVSKAHITYRFRRLAERGLVERAECPQDARGAFVALTPSGLERIREAAPTHVAGVRRHLLDHLSERQLAAIGEGMRAVLDATAGMTGSRRV